MSDTNDSRRRPKPKPVWRVGRKLGRTIYMHDQLVGMMDAPELARLVVDVMNLMTDAVTSGGGRMTSRGGKR